MKKDEREIYGRIYVSFVTDREAEVGEESEDGLFVEKVFKINYSYKVKFMPPNHFSESATNYVLPKGYNKYVNKLKEEIIKELHKNNPQKDILFYRKIADDFYDLDIASNTNLMGVPRLFTYREAFQTKKSKLMKDFSISFPTKFSIDEKGRFK